MMNINKCSRRSVFSCEKLVTWVSELPESLVQNGNGDVKAYVGRCECSGLRNLGPTSGTPAYFWCGVWEDPEFSEESHSSPGNLLSWKNEIRLILWKTERGHSVHSLLLNNLCRLISRNAKDCQQTTRSQERGMGHILPHSLRGN